VDGVCSTDILVIAAKLPEAFGIVLFHLSSDQLVKYATITSTGTKMPRTNWHDLAEYKILIPPRETMQDFTAVISPMIKMISNNILQLKKLASIRDSLLPKLMSGKIRVPVSDEVEG
ncbi:MAG: restriction endonuclease subunit S, partial [Candidatus Bathyarchaeota archaeon]|nr:restriction endonuclease subunit S [Candidatus Bathyarchaeum sp.]